jgi:hypothetical protein
MQNVFYCILCKKNQVCRQNRQSGVGFFGRRMWKNELATCIAPLLKDNTSVSVIVCSYLLPKICCVSRRTRRYLNDVEVDYATYTDYETESQTDILVSLSDQRVVAEFGIVARERQQQPQYYPGGRRFFFHRQCQVLFALDCEGIHRLYTMRQTSDEDTRSICWPEELLGCGISDLEKDFRCTEWGSWLIVTWYGAHSDNMTLAIPAHASISSASIVECADPLEYVDAHTGRGFVVKDTDHGDEQHTYDSADLFVRSVPSLSLGPNMSRAQDNTRLFRLQREIVGCPDSWPIVELVDGVVYTIGRSRPDYRKSPCYGPQVCAHSLYAAADTTVEADDRICLNDSDDLFMSSLSFVCCGPLAEQTEKRSNESTQDKKSQAAGVWVVCIGNGRDSKDKREQIVLFDIMQDGYDIHTWPVPLRLNVHTCSVWRLGRDIVAIAGSRVVACWHIKHRCWVHYWDRTSAITEPDTSIQLVFASSNS